MRRYLIAAILLSSSALVAPAQAQSSGRETASRDIGGRVDRLEGEMRAVQRKVFPGGGGQYIEPENQPAAPDAILSGSPTSPVADLATRVDSLENQLRGLTSQVETNEHRLQLLEGRIKTLETATPPAPAPSGADEFGDPPPRRGADRPDYSASDRNLDRPAAAKPVVAKPTPVTAVDRASAAPKDLGKDPGKDPGRAAKLAEIERSDSGDTAEDTYLYGYHLWAAKLYPEAEAQFTTVTTKFPTHKRASYAQNLLGRSYLDDGKPSLASLAFYDNYKKWPDGDRAPESLYYLAQALVKLDKPAAQVCKVYAELLRSYGAKIDADPKMKAGVAKGRATSNCS